MFVSSFELLLETLLLGMSIIGVTAITIGDEEAEDNKQGVMVMGPRCDALQSHPRNRLICRPQLRAMETRRKIFIVIDGWLMPSPHDSSR